MNDSSYRALLDLADGVYRLHASAGEVIGDNIIDSEPRSLWGSLKLAVTRRSDSDPCLFGEHRGSYYYCAVYLGGGAAMGGLVACRGRIAMLVICGVYPPT